MSRHLSRKIIKKSLHPFKIFFSVIVAGLLLGVCLHVFADGTDILAGTTTDVTTTLGGSGKKWLYIIEGVAAIFSFIQTKNVFVFGGIAAVCLMVNVVLHFAGS